MRKALFHNNFIEKMKRKRSDGGEQDYRAPERGRSPRRQQIPRSIPAISIQADRVYFNPGSGYIDSYKPDRDSRSSSRDRYTSSRSPSLYSLSSRGRSSRYDSSSSLSSRSRSRDSSLDRTPRLHRGRQDRSRSPPRSGYLTPPTPTPTYPLQRTNSYSSTHSTTSTTSFTSTLSLGALRLSNHKCVVNSKSSFAIGMIIWAPLHEQPYVTSDPSKVSESPWGPVFSKLRPFIIVAMHANNYIALPCFTHQSRGLTETKLASNKHEWVSLQDHRIGENIVQQSSHKRLSTCWFSPECSVFSAKTTVHLTAPHSRDYAYPCAIAGMLTEGSTRRVVELYMNGGASGEKDLSGSKDLEPKEGKDEKTDKKTVKTEDEEREEGEIDE